jgi:hypothetical protein
MSYNRGNYAVAWKEEETANLVTSQPVSTQVQLTYTALDAPGTSSGSYAKSKKKTSRVHTRRRIF